MDVIFTVNAGSSSLKCAGYAMPDLVRIYSCHVSGIGTTQCEATGDSFETEVVSPSTQSNALDRALDKFRSAYPEARIAACSHRVVHGGTDYAAPILINEATLASLEELSVLAPLHQPHNLAGVRAMQQAMPGSIQIACFDTEFHRGHPRAAEVYALPQEITAAGVRRFGFHGLSYEYIAKALQSIDPELAAGEVIVAHLGAGASLCAMRDGQSVDSTMGFTALDGLPMATRTGQLDPGVVIHLLRGGRSLDDVERMFYRESGLKGLSGESGDMRELIASKTPNAAFAIDYFCYRVAREIGALAISLNGLDGVVFTAGVGENQPEIRADIAGRLNSIGVKIDHGRNEAGDSRFEAAESQVKLLCIPTDEEAMLAQHAARFLR